MDGLTDGSRGIVHSPEDISRATTEWANRWTGDYGLGFDFGVDIVDQDMLPFRPGRQTIVIARPGNGKTTLLCYITTQICKQLIERQQPNKAVIAFTWEQYVEELAATIAATPGAMLGEIERGEANPNAITEMGMRLLRLPLWIVGYSYELQDYVITSLDGKSHKLPKLTPDAITSAVDWIYNEYGVEPAAFTYDYLQEMTIPGDFDKRQQVDSAAHTTKEMALRYEAPSIVAAQAKREVDDYKFKTPMLGDCQWSSVGEQVSDTVLGLWMPYIAMGQGELDIHGTRYEVTPKMLVCRMNKQRGGIPRATWVLAINHRRLSLSEYVEIEDLY